jgi:hypothetical protein
MRAFRLSQSKSVLVLRMEKEYLEWKMRVLQMRRCFEKSPSRAREEEVRNDLYHKKCMHICICIRIDMYIYIIYIYI